MKSFLARSTWSLLLVSAAVVSMHAYTPRAREYLRLETTVVAGDVSLFSASPLVTMGPLSRAYATHRAAMQFFASPSEGMSFQIWRIVSYVRPLDEYWDDVVCE